MAVRHGIGIMETKLPQSMKAFSFLSSRDDVMFFHIFAQFRQLCKPPEEKHTDRFDCSTTVVPLGGKSEERLRKACISFGSCLEAMVEVKGA